MPFAHQSSGIAATLEAIREGGLREWQPARPFGIKLMAEARLVAPRQQPRTSGRAIRPADVAAREAHARRRERVEIRRGDFFAAVKTHVGIAHVIADDEQDVWLAVGGLQHGERAVQQGGEE